MGRESETPRVEAPSAAMGQVVLRLLVSIAAVAALDWWTGPHLGFSIFYAVPVGLATWHGGRFVGLAAAVLGMGVWGTIEMLDTPRPHPAYHFWNAVVRGGTFLAIAYLIARVRDLLGEQTALASRDGLTGLANARAFVEAVDAELSRSRRTGRTFALAYCDLDDFKRVNDTLGHAAGDRVLLGVADLLRARLRSTDLAARLGGDEFALLLRETDGAGAEHVVRELHAAIQAHLGTLGSGVGASLGLVSFRAPPDTPDAAIQAADSLMYTVKAEGKRDVRCLEWPPSTDDAANASDAAPAAAAAQRG